MLRYFILAGEKSGDQHAACLVKAIREKQPLSSFCGIAGPAMRLAGVIPYLAAEKLSVMGFFDVIKALPALAYHFLSIRRAILQGGFDAVIFIDYPGFNLRMALSLRKKGYRGKLFQYIAPTVWAHGKKRIETMSSTLDGLMTILPFEKSCFSHCSLPVEYVGNPVAEACQIASYDTQWRQKNGLPLNKRLIACYPGSRLAEIRRNLPIMLEAWQLAKYEEKQDDRLVICSSCALCRSLIEQTVHRSPFSDRISIIDAASGSFELMKEAHAALAKSGTVTLELALHGCPSVVLYKTTSFDRFIARRLLKVNLAFFSLPNIILGKRVFNEHIQEGCDPLAIAGDLQRAMTDEAYRYEVKQQCAEVKKLLGDLSPSQRAAEFILL